MTANKKLPKSGPYFMRYLETSLPTAYINARQALGKEAAKVEKVWEVRPGAHYMMGGVRVNNEGASVGGTGEGSVKNGINGFYAAGQAMGGLFGANRLGSTSLTELAVFGTRSGKSAAKYALNIKFKVNKELFIPYITEYKAIFEQKGSVSATSLKNILQKESWSKIGPVRLLEGLNKIDALIADLEIKLKNVSIPNYTIWNQPFLDYMECKNMLYSAKAISLAARKRDGSIGGHVRLDGKNISIFSQPYSTVVRKESNTTFLVDKLHRKRTPIKELVRYKILEFKRLMEAKILLMLPKSIQDQKLEKRYKAIMSVNGKAPELMPGGDEAAIGDSNRA